MLPVLDILKIDAEKNHQGVAFDQILNAFLNASVNSNVRMLLKGNTILVLELLPSEPHEFHFINAAPFEEFVDNVICTFYEAQLMGVHTMKTYFTNRRIFDVAKRIPFDYSVDKEDDQFTLTVRL